MIYVFLSTVQFDPISALIRWRTMCDWSHTGFYDADTGMTFSAMYPKGVQWRKPSPKAKILLLEIPGADEACQYAQQWEGLPYDLLDIAGMLVRRNWKSAKGFICDRMVFQAFIGKKNPLLNHRYIPIEHLYPESILLSDKIMSSQLILPRAGQ